MINQVYQLIVPRRIAAISKEVTIDKESILVRPLYISICAADQRYFQGKRDYNALKKKLPMALIHEAVGEVVYDPTQTFTPRDKVVLIPNQPTENHSEIAENYLRSSKFRGSGYDGFSQDLVQISPDRLVKISEKLPLNTLAFTELVSVAYSAINRFILKNTKEIKNIGVWGDGNVGYIVSLLLKYMLPHVKVTVLGKIEEKLQYFSFVDETYHVDDIPEDMVFDHTFECVGGVGSQYAINQMIDHICPEGIMNILGVSETLVQVNTRMVLEKGLIMLGSSRSGRKDFQGVINLYEKHPEIIDYLENLIGLEVEVRSITDFINAFDSDIKLEWGKTVIKWQR